MCHLFNPERYNVSATSLECGDLFLNNAVLRDFAVAYPSLAVRKSCQLGAEVMGIR
jgi:hypothetical protein